MINNENKNEIIEQYLLGELSGELLNEVNHKLATDDKFRAEVAFERSIMRNIRTVGRSDYRLKLEGFHQEMGEEPELEEPDVEAEQQNTGGKVIKMNVRKYWLMAAASIALVITSTLTLNTFLESGNNPEAIYNAVYSPYPGNGTRSAATPDTKARAMAAYDAQNYSESIKLFKQVLQNSEDDETLLYLGNAYLGANQPEEAIKTFKAYLSQYTEFEVEAKWYLALSYLKTDNEEEAKKVLEELAAVTNDETLEYREKAREILNKLD